MTRPPELDSELHDLIVELQITGSPVLEMWNEPERAVAVLRHAKHAERIRNRAAFAVGNWNTGFDPRPAYPAPAESEDEGEPPSLSGLEYMWSVPQSYALELLLDSAGCAIAAAGGFDRLLREGWHERERFDFD